MSNDDELPPQDDEGTHGVFTDLGDAEIVAPRWIVENALPEGFVILGGPPKGNKSTLTVGWAALVAGNKCTALPPEISKVPTHGSVMWFSYEATAGELRHIAEQGLSTHIESNGTILVADDPWAWRLDNDRSLEEMQRWLNKRRPKLMILDPLRNFHQLDENDSRIIQLLTPLRKWAVKNNACVLVVHHAVKPDKDTGKFTANHLRGSGALFGMADAVLMVTPLNAQRTRIHLDATFKKAAAIQQDMELAIWGHTLDTPGDVLDDLDRLVLAALAGGPRTKDELAQRVRIGKKLALVLGKLERMKLVVKEDSTYKALEIVLENDPNDD
jgi:hypothetical protein